jgi:hypothetical protein
MRRWILASGLALALLAPTAAFAAHVAGCCGDPLYCLQHLLGCCP